LDPFDNADHRRLSLAMRATTAKRETYRPAATGPAGQTITPAALSEFPLILMQRDASVRAIVEAGFHSAGLMPKATCEAIYMMTAVGMVRAGLGLTILPGSAREINAEPSLQSKRIDDPKFTRPVSIIKRSGRTLPPLSEAFLQHLSICLGATLE
jgi:DNA-binding transcriptional LysR family regulator